MTARLALAATLLAAAPAFAQGPPPQVIPEHPVAPTVYVNPRSAPSDPRTGLKGGLYDAGQAISGLQLVLTSPKPGHFAPDLAAINKANSEPAPPPPTPGSAPGGRGFQRGPSYGGTNSDLAFNSKYLFSGNYEGINIYDLSDPTKLKLTTSIICPGGQGDVSVYKNLMFMSVEAANGRLDCGTQGFPTPEHPAAPPTPGTRPVEAPSMERIKGVRIFDISDITHPKQVADVQTCRGSHTHTILIDPKDKDDVFVYVAGSAPVRPEEELGGCSGKDPKDDPNTALYTIVVIKVPLAHPELAKVVSSPKIFSDPVTGDPDGLWKGGTHGDGTNSTSATRGCHDITMYSWLGIAAGACSGNGILLDIKDPVHPVRLDAVTDPGFAFWHSANFANDGKSVLFTDEWGGGGQPHCRAVDPMAWGADAIFKLDNKKKLTLSSYYKMPAIMEENKNCVAHNGSLVPVPGRNILVQSWYQGGISLMDFTDPTHPYEIGYFTRGPIGVDGRRAGGGDWSSYFFNGYIYASEMARGIDVLKLTPTRYLTQNEIDAAAQVHFDELNVQNQPHIDYPLTFTTGKAYLDQLVRSNALTATKAAAIVAAMDGKKSKELKTFAVALNKEATTANPIDAGHMTALAQILTK
jgi:hypothetical protein